MPYCINPNCPNRINPTIPNCQSCGTKLLLNDRYHILQSLRNQPHPYTDVFEILDTETQTQKCLKVINSKNTQILDLFTQEQKLIISLSHPGLPKGEAAFNITTPDAELHCFVMGKVPGQNLQDWVQSHGAIDAACAINWLKQLTEILGFIHDRQLIHRDIKPSNIMLRPDNKLVLIDFGTARQVTETVLKGRTTTAVFAYGYTPPEQLSGRVVPQSDFYALGQTLIHLLTGHPPAPDWQSRLSQKLPIALTKLLQDLTQEAPKQRPQNAAIILKRLRRIEQQVLLPQLTQWAGIFLGAAGLAFGLSTIWPTLQNQYWPEACDRQLDDHLSCGEQALLSDYAAEQLLQAPPPHEKEQGITAFQQGRWAESIELFKTAWAQQRDPETLIYWNNARLQTVTNVRTIAVAVPLSKSPGAALEILRGVAQAQQIAIDQNIPLRVVIADDGSNLSAAQLAAQTLVKKRDILAVVGHFTSDITKEVLPIYHQGKMLLISPTSTSTDLSNQPGFLRTTPSDSVTAQALAYHLLINQQIKQVSIGNSPQSNFSRSFTSQFRNTFETIGRGRVTSEFDLSLYPWDTAAFLASVQREKPNAIALIPDSGTSRHAFANSLKVLQTVEDRSILLVGGDTLYNSAFLQANAVDRLIVGIPWHEQTCPKASFVQEAQKLWRGNISWRTATSYDATWVLITALAQATSPARIQALPRGESFQIQGATGLVRFERSDRAKPAIALVKVVAQGKGYQFVPIQTGESCQIP